MNRENPGVKGFLRPLANVGPPEVLDPRHPVRPGIHVNKGAIKMISL
jgi:hypothetical protein